MVAARLRCDLRGWLIVAAILLPKVAQSVEPEAPGPLSPDEALRSLIIHPDLQVELVAAEPQVVDPVAVRFDARGRMWVVEMGDYPHGPEAGEPPRSKIKVLEDRDGDGRYEHSVLFADGLLFATGLQPWRGGVIVTLAGRVAWLRDEDGDGRADVEEIWFSGFAEENSQLRANHPTLALDNYVYIANGLRGGQVRDARREGTATVSIRSMDFRFDPRGEHYEAVSGFGQFGLTFDDFGRRFECSNRNPLRHIVLEDRYLRTGGNVIVTDTGWDVAAMGEASKLFPRTRAWTTSTLHANQFTAACGVHIYRGDALPARLRGAAFVCDPTANLVHCEIMTPLGATFTSKPERDGVELLASTDEWFRPVNLETGPDGALYVVDMYRAVIEHPEFMPDELKQRPDLRWGEDRGRIYRVTARHAQQTGRTNLETLSPLDLVGALNTENGWRRDTAQRLLLESAPLDNNVVAALRQLAHSQSAAASRLHALWLLDGIGQLTDQDLLRALQDGAARVREAACLLAERKPVDDQLRAALLALADDEDTRVRFQAALSLAPLRSADEVPQLARIAVRSADDPWTRRAVALAGGPYTNLLANAVLNQLRARAAAQPSAAPAGGAALLEELFSAAASTDGAAGNTDKDVVLLGRILTGDEPAPQLTVAALRGALRGWTRRSWKWQTALDADPQRRMLWDEVMKQADAVARDVQREVAERQQALQLLGLAQRSDTILALALDSASPQSLRIQAVSQMPPLADEATWERLLDDFPGLSPAVRSAVSGAALNSLPATKLLLVRIEAGTIKPQELDRLHADRLLQHGDQEIQTRASELFAAATPQQRREALAKYQSALQLEGDALRGREIFSKNCATCHRIGDLGVDVAPDIADSRTKTPQQLLTDILQPNQAIDGNYIAYVVQTEDGRTLTGIVTGETTVSVALKLPEGQVITLLREEIAVMRSTGVSLMPEALEQNISLQQMADLISFIKNWRYLDGRTPLGTADTN